MDIGTALTSVRARGKKNSPPSERRTAAAGIHATDMIAIEVVSTAPKPTARARKVAIMGPASLHHIYIQHNGTVSSAAATALMQKKEWHVVNRFVTKAAILMSAEEQVYLQPG